MGKNKRLGSGAVELSRNAKQWKLHDIHVTILPVNEYASYEHEHQLEVNLHLNNIYKKYISFSDYFRTDMLLVYLFICTALVGDQVEVEAC